MDAALLEYLGRKNALPGRRHLNQDTVLADACIFIESDEFLGFGDGRLGIKRETGVDLRADDAGDDLVDLCADAHCEAVDLVSHSLLRRRQRRDFVSKFRQGRGLQQQRGVGGGVRGFQPCNGLEITRISHNRGHGAQLFQLIHDLPLAWGRAQQCPFLLSIESLAERSRLWA